MAVNFLEALADALQAPLRGAMCALTPSAFSVGVGYPGSLSIGAVFPNTCGQPVPPEISPVVGGQCPTLYNVNIGVRRPDGTLFAPIPFANVQGPITGVGGEWIEDFTGQLRFTAFIIAPNDTEPPTPGFRKFGPFTGYADPTKASRSYIVSIARVDGLPDNCGSGGTPPPPPAPPPTGTTTNITFDFGGITYNLGSPTFTIYPTVNIPIYGGLHIPINLTFAPSIGFPGGINLPVYLSLPDLNINPRISFFNLDLSAEIKAPEVKITFPDPPATISPDLEYVERLVGLEVVTELATPNRNSSITGSGSASDLLVPWLAIVRFVPPDGLGYSESIDIPIKTLEQYVPVPWFYGADGYTILENQGVTCSVTEIRAEVANLVKPL